MEDIQKLKITIPYGEFGSVQMDLDSKLGYVFKLLQDCFDKIEVMNDLNLNRYTVIQAEIMILNDNEFNEYFNKDEVDELVKRLTDEEQQVRALLELKNNNRKSSIFSKFDQRLNLLKQLTQ